MNKDEKYKIYNEDCLVKLKDIGDKSIDLVLIDPPYNIGKDKWDKWKTVDDYVDFMGQVFKECERVLKDNGSFYFFHNDFLQIVELQNYINKNTNFQFKQLITWSKIHEDFKNYGYVQQRLSIDMMRNYYNGFTEYCLYYIFQDETGLNIKQDRFLKLMNYFREERLKLGWNYKQCDDYLGIKASYCYWDKPTTHPYIIPDEEHYLKLQETGHFKKPYDAIRQEYEELRYTFNTTRVKEDLRANSNVWLYPPAKKQGHITPKPVEMLENIIKHSTDGGDVVLDCFMGSGSTGVACLNTKRKFIGIEIDEKYFNIAKERIEMASRQKRLF